jgi:hypothetical protein
MHLRGDGDNEALAMIYSDFYVIRTRQAVYLELLITFTLTFTLVILGSAPSNEWWEYVPQMLVKLSSLALPVTLTIKILTHLGEQEKRVGEPDANMRLLFLVAILTPILGFMPVVVFL